MLKLFVASLITFVSLHAFSQDPSTTLKLFDSKVYTLKNKGVKDFVVDISSTKLTQHINSLGTFGTVKDLYFRVFWTLNPERLDIEVMGLPEGFKEVKEELQLSALALVENILPPPMEKKFSGYKFSAAGNGQLVAKDSSGVAEIPTMTFKLDSQLRLLEVYGAKPIGFVKVMPVYEKEAFSDGRWVLKKQITTAQENGQEVTTTKTLSYGQQDGFSVLRTVTLNTEQKFLSKPDKPVSVSEVIEFKNYKLNNGEAVRHFIKDAPVP